MDKDTKVVERFWIVQYKDEGEWWPSNLSRRDTLAGAQELLKVKRVKSPSTEYRILRRETLEVVE